MVVQDAEKRLDKHTESLKIALAALNSTDRIAAFEVANEHRIVARMREDCQIPARKVNPKASGQVKLEASGPVATQPEHDGGDLLSVPLRDALVSGTVTWTTRWEKAPTQGDEKDDKTNIGD